MKFEGKDFPDIDGAADKVGNAETCDNASLMNVLYLLKMMMMMMKMMMMVMMMMMMMMMMMVMMMMMKMMMMMMMMMKMMNVTLSLTHYVLQRSGRRYDCHESKISHHQQDGCSPRPPYAVPVHRNLRTR